MRHLSSCPKPHGSGLKAYESTVFNAFQELASRSDDILITTGYVSSNALNWLINDYCGLFEARVRLNVGMHDAGVISRPQLDALRRLGAHLAQERRGEVRVATEYPVHAKTAIFTAGNESIGAIVGSSNLGSLLGSPAALECDVEVSPTDAVGSLSPLFEAVWSQSTPVRRWLPKNVSSHAMVDMSEVAGVTEIPEDGPRFKGRATGLRFELPLKTTPKANLNTCFGKGRPSSTVREIKRLWNEVSLIVPVAITRMPGYPRAEPGKTRYFRVVTDDGYSFQCHTTGDNGKNFESSPNLHILGEWIKGRLMVAGALELGDPVTDDTLARYGRDTVTLSATVDPEVWLLDLSVP